MQRKLLLASTPLFVFAQVPVALRADSIITHAQQRRGRKLRDIAERQFIGAVVDISVVRPAEDGRIALVDRGTYFRQANEGRK